MVESPWDEGLMHAFLSIPVLRNRKGQLLLLPEAFDRPGVAQLWLKRPQLLFIVAAVGAFKSTLRVLLGMLRGKCGGEGCGTRCCCHQ